jgi:hypothetical protein
LKFKFSHHFSHSHRILFTFIQGYENNFLNFNIKELKFSVVTMDFKAQKEIKRDPFKVRVLLLEKIAPRINLSRILHSLIAGFTSVIGIARVADYNHRLRDDSCFIYFCDGNEYLNLLALGTFHVDGQLVAVSAPHIVPINAKLSMPSSSYPPHLMAQCPPSMGLFNLRLNIGSPIIMVLSALEAYEASNSVTGMIVAYDIKRKRPRNFGFMMMLSRVQMLEALGGSPIIQGQKVQVRPAKAVPALIHEITANEIIRRGPINNAFLWTEEIMNANWLKANIGGGEPIRPRVSLPDFVPPPAQPAIQPFISEPTLQPQPSTSKAVTQPKPVAEPNSATTNAVPHSIPTEPTTLQPASPTLSIGDNYELTEDGDLAVPPPAKRRRLN